MTLLLVATAVAAALWFAFFGLVRMWTRPPEVTAEVAVADLAGDEPPAVVSLIANRWRLSEDTAESTLIDLAARRYLEFRQPGNDRLHTTVHTLPVPARDAGTTGYERMVLDRVHALAVDGVVPLTALTFRDPGEASSWTSRLHAAVIAEARERGLTTRRISPPLVCLLSTLAAIPAGLAALTVLADREHDAGAALGAAVIVFGLLSGYAARPQGERDTPAGLAAARRWAALQKFLAGDDAFVELPPAAVAVWDRYLAYGDALGVTRVCSALIDLGMGDRKRVWSSFGGTWHRVRVTYPRFGSRYGATVWRIVLPALGALVVGWFVLRKLSPSLDAGDRVGFAVTVIGVGLIVRALYRLARFGSDLLAPRTLTGEVLWVELWKSTQERENKPSRPLVHYLALDSDGAATTTAWALPSEWSHQARAGDVVTVEIRPWTRRITSLRVDSSRAQHLAEVTGADLISVQQAEAQVTGGAVTAGMGAAGAVLPGAGAREVVTAAVLASAAVAGSVPLLTAPEVSAALGREVGLDPDGVRLRFLELEHFSAPGERTPVLTLTVGRGSAAALATRGLDRSSPLAGLAGVAGVAGVAGTGDEAWSGPGWVGARAGDAVVRITADADPAALATLLGTALARLPAAGAGRPA